MGNTADKLNYLEGTKAAIRQSIETKGVIVNDSDTFRSYSEKIGEIASSSVNSDDLIDEFNTSYPYLADCIVHADLSDVDASRISQWSDQFFNCRNLETLVLPNNMPSEIDASSNSTGKWLGLFEGCTKLKTISNWPDDFFPYVKNSTSNGRIIIPSNNITKECLVDLFNHLKKVNVGRGVVQIKSSAYNKLSSSDRKIATDKNWSVQTL